MSRKVVLPYYVAVALAFLAAGVGHAPAARAQEEHVHNWIASPDIEKPSFGVDRRYARVGEVIELTFYSNMDFDTCTAECCPLYDEGWEEGTQTYDSSGPSSWGDGGAGVTFGRMVNGAFEACSGPQVTHYKCPLEAQVVALTVTADDQALLADDAPRSSDPVPITVWDFTISNGAAGWVPAMWVALPFTAAIAPAKDHLDNSLASTITFHILCSQEPGYCLNKTRQEGDDYDTWGNDLEFLPPQAGLSITSTDPAPEVGRHYDTATTQTAVLSATASVTCLDYGAYGSVTAEADVPVQEIGQVGARLGSTPPSDPHYQAQMPVDTNNNHIADSAQVTVDGVLVNFDSGQGLDDDDDDPHGDGSNGDRLSLYEEYRGLVCNASWTRLSPHRKDVFLRVRDGLDTWLLTTANLGAPLHYVLENEMGPPTSRNINSNGGTCHLGAQTAIVVWNGAYSASGGWGSGHAWQAPWVTNNEDYCKVYVTTIQSQASGLNAPPQLSSPVGVGDTSTTLADGGAYADFHRYQRASGVEGVGGEFTIDSETLAYNDLVTVEDPPGSGIWASRFSGFSATAPHAAGRTISFFSHPQEVIRVVLAHEVGHLMNLDHRDSIYEVGFALGWHNIMARFRTGGATDNSGYWGVFRDPARGEDALVDQFRVLP